MDQALTNDFKYYQSGRHYPNNSVTTSSLLDPKNQLGRNSLGPSLSFGNSNLELSYSSTQLQHEGSCNTASSQLILTPPQSGDESSSTITNPSSTSFSYSSLPKVTGSNASGPEYYSSGIPTFTRSGFNGLSMTHIDGRGAPTQIPAPLSPPYSYGPMNSSSFPPDFTMARTTYDPTYSYASRPASYDIFRPRPQMPHPFSSTTSSIFPAPPMPAANRPEGPPFEDTVIIHPLVNSRGQNLKVDVLASIPKGFFKVEDKWTCYRRNYFTVSCGFTFKTHSLDSQVFCQRYASQAEHVHGYAVSIAAKTAVVNNNDSETRGLVQHTPKRDKATESVPTRHAIVPTPAQSLSNGHNISHNGIYTSSSHHLLPHGLDPFTHPNGPSPQTNYTFERIQFQKATANNGKRRAQQQFFHVVVRLEANLGRPGGPDEWVIVATQQSHPMVVRGRSPGHYKDSRRDSQTSMDPDGGSGQSGDGHSNFPLHALGPNHSANMSNAHATYRHSHHYGTSFSYTSHRVDESDSSSTSPESSTTLCSSSSKGETCRIPCSMTRTPLTFDRILLSPTVSKIDSDLMEYTTTATQYKKRPFDDDSDCTSSFFQSSLHPTYHHTPSFDFSATSAAQALCVSS
ncbi:hypothetical protein LTS08_001288 [Lithohypha guttulata]|nr:hypothetical protein LTS08_001288 [Lithohypha guttulata]